MQMKRTILKEIVPMLKLQGFVLAHSSTGCYDFETLMEAVSSDMISRLWSGLNSGFPSLS